MSCGSLRAHGNDDGAQRVAWTDVWVQAREWLAAKVRETGAEESVDEAGNQWFTLRGTSDKALLIGGHIDSVPNGGWLDGALNVMAGVEVLRRIAGDGEPAATVRLVNWADEEEPASAARCSDRGGRRDDGRPGRAPHAQGRGGNALPDVVSQHGVELDRALEARAQLENAGAYLELHIEQGPCSSRSTFARSRPRHLRRRAPRR